MKERKSEGWKLFIALLLLIPLNIRGEFIPRALSFNLMSESLSLPSYKLIRIPIHPGFQVSAELREKTKGNRISSINVNCRYYYHRYQEHAIMINLGYDWGYDFSNGLRPELLLGIGIKHTILPGPVYKLENGEYEKTTHFGRPLGNMTLGIGLEYAVNKQYSIISGYRMMAALPWQPKKEMPFSAHILFELGVKIKLDFE